jgi:hypothetical protein
MASGLVHYVVSDGDVSILAQIGAGRRVRQLPIVSGEEYPAVVVRNTQGGGLHDLLVFVDGTQPYFRRDVVAGTGQAGTFNATPQKASVG